VALGLYRVEQVIDARLKQSGRTRMMSDSQLLLAMATAGLNTIALVIGILINNARQRDLRANVESLFAHVDSLFAHVDRRFDKITRSGDPSFTP
jgi:hypothetical protein